jgi:hypothetical protein
MNDWFSPAHRLWATISLGAAILWIIFSALLPTPITTFIGVPFAITALLAGWYSRRESRKQADQSGARRATWGLGLTCAGCVWQVIYLTILGGIGLTLLLGGGGALLHAIQGTPTP